MIKSQAVLQFHWKWMSAWCPTNLGATVWHCSAGCWNWNHKLAWLVLFIGIYLVCLLFVCILFAVCPGKDLFAGRLKPGKSSWNCKPSWNSASLDETQMCKFGQIHLPIWGIFFRNMDKYTRPGASSWKCKPSWFSGCLDGTWASVTSLSQLSANRKTASYSHILFATVLNIKGWWGRVLVICQLRQELFTYQILCATIYPTPRFEFSHSPTARCHKSFSESPQDLPYHSGQLGATQGIWRTECMTPLTQQKNKK